MLSDNFIPRANAATVGLNPCSNGICSLIVTDISVGRNWGLRLNPCSNGICSLIFQIIGKTGIRSVLILVLMEYAL